MPTRSLCPPRNVATCNRQHNFRALRRADHAAHSWTLQRWARTLRRCCVATRGATSRRCRELVTPRRGKRCSVVNFATTARRGAPEPLRGVHRPKQRCGAAAWWCPPNFCKIVLEFKTALSDLLGLIGGVGAIRLAKPVNLAKSIKSGNQMYY